MTVFVATSAPDDFEEEPTELFLLLDADGNVIETSTSFNFLNDNGGPGVTVEVTQELATSTVDYADSTAGIFVDLTRNPQTGGYAEGDLLVNITNIEGSAFNDVIRGSNLFATFYGSDPGNNRFFGGGGDDILEGRGGEHDALIGGAGSDTASYESSGGPVFVTLFDPPLFPSGFVAGGDAAGDELASIENLAGSRFDDFLQGGPDNNILAGGFGNDTLDGAGGIDTADYSRDRFIDANRTADFVVVRLVDGLGASRADEFVGSTRVSTDALIGIENVTGTDGGDTITGNNQANVLDGRGGNDLLDGGLGNDTIIGGANTDTASYASHNSLTTFEIGNIALGLGIADGIATYTAFSPQGTPLIETDTLRGIENITGSNFNETIAGNERNNVLDGAGGVNTVSFVSHDSISAFFNETNVIILGSGGADGAYLRQGLVQIPATGQFLPAIESDVLRNFQNVTGSNRAETIIGNAQNNVLNGRGGNDIIDGGDGNDTMIGGGGTNTASFLSHDSLPAFIGETNLIVLGLGGADGAYLRQGLLFNLVTGQPVFVSETDVLREFQNVTGSNRVETIIGNELANILDGRGGNDVIDGGLGNDTMIGGAGINTASFASHNSVTTTLTGAITLGVGSADGSATYTGSGAPETDVLRQFDNVIGSKFNETITGNERANVLDGGAGNDTIIGGGGIDTASFVSHDSFALNLAAITLGQNGADGTTTFRSSVDGSIEHDTLRGSIVNVTGTNLGETIIANEQDNTINGRGGNDGLQGGGGNDTYDYRGATGSQGNDQARDINGTADRLLVDNLSDVLGTQQVGTDLLVTMRTGSVLILGHFAGTPIESIVDSQGNSLILATGSTGGNGSGIISGTSGADVMDGRGGDDLLFGNAGNDRLLGGKGDDRLYGGDGRDVLIGGPGSDFLVGGPDADSFVFRPSAFGGGHGNDAVADFSSAEHDRIDVSAFHTSFAALTHGHGPITLTTDGEDSFLTFAHGTVQIVGATHLHAVDFIF